MALRRIKAEVSAAMALRRSRCIQRCLPPLSRDQWFAWFGTRDEAEQADPWGGTVVARLAEDEGMDNAQGGWDTWQGASNGEDWEQWGGWEQSNADEGSGSSGANGAAGEPEGEPDSAPMSQTQGSAAAWEDITANLARCRVTDVQATPPTGLNMVAAGSTVANGNDEGGSSDPLPPPEGTCHGIHTRIAVATNTQARATNCGTTAGEGAGTALPP